MFYKALALLVGLISCSGCSTPEEFGQTKEFSIRQTSETFFDCKPKKTNFINAYYIRS